MARRFFQVAFWAALIHLGITSALCHAQAPASPSPTASPAVPGDNTKGGKRDRPFLRENLSPEQQKKYDNLPPDQQEKMKENWERWQQMSPVERKAMREREEERRQMIIQEIEDALKQSDLQLDDKTRDEYVMRYTEERRKIEQKLQQEMEEKRRPLVQALVNRLKAEFQGRSSAAAASPSPSPEASASPSK